MLIENAGIFQGHGQGQAHGQPMSILGRDERGAIFFRKIPLTVEIHLPNMSIYGMFKLLLNPFSQHVGGHYSKNFAIVKKKMNEVVK